MQLLGGPSSFKLSRTIRNLSDNYNSTIVGYSSGGQNGQTSTADFEWRVNGVYFSHTGGAGYTWNNVTNGMNWGNWPTLGSGDVVELDTTVTFSLNGIQKLTAFQIKYKLHWSVLLHKALALIFQGMPKVFNRFTWNHTNVD